MGDNHDRIKRCMKKYQEMTTREIADITGIEISRVSGCLNNLQKFKIVKKLKKKVKKLEAEYGRRSKLL